MGSGQTESELPGAARWVAVSTALIWLAVLAAAYRDVLSLGPGSTGVDPIESFFFDTATTIPFLHYMLFGFIILNRLHGIRAALTEKSAYLSGTAVLILGVALFAWAKFSKQIDLEIDSLVLVLVGSTLFLGGRKLLERLVLPLFLLWLARPWPPMLTHHVHEWLQRLTGSLVVTVLSPFSEVGRSGHLLSFRGQLFEVIEGCSGLRLGVTLLVAILVYLDLVSRSRLQTLGVLLVTVMLSPVLNGLRVVSIMINPASEISQIHSTQGLIVISFGVVLIAVVDRALDRRVWPVGDRTWRSANSAVGVSISGAVLVAPAIVTVLLLGISFAPFQRPRNLELSTWALHEVQPRLGAWKRTQSKPLDRNFLGSVRFRDKLLRDYTRDGDGRQATLFVAADDRRRRDRSSLSPKTQSLGARWVVLDTVPVRVGNPEIDAFRSIQQAGQVRMLTLHYRIGEGGFVVEMLRWMLAIDLWPGFVPNEIITVRIAIPIDPADPGRSFSTLSDFQREVWAALARADPRSELKPQ